MLDLGLRAHDLDAVICVFGIFFVPDMEAAIRELWRMVRPGACPHDPGARGFSNPSTLVYALATRGTIELPDKEMHRTKHGF